MVVQPCLCMNWSETSQTSFLVDEAYLLPFNVVIVFVLKLTFFLSHLLSLICCFMLCVF